jgi:hypothetical protein
MEALVFFAVFLGGIFLVSIIIVALLRRVLWAFSGLFLLVDELMWLLYYPLRGSVGISTLIHAKGI